MRSIYFDHSTILYNPIFDAIEVHFDNHGTMKSYHKTMEEALNLALMENVNRWIFTKDSFSDLNITQFLSFLRKWVINGCNVLKSRGLASLCEVAIITKSQNAEKLKIKFNSLQTGKEKSGYLELNICNSEEEIYEYF